MTVLTLEEFRGIVPEKKLAVKLRQDAFMIWGPHTNSPVSQRESEPKSKGCLSALARRLFRLSFRGS